MGQYLTTPETARALTECRQLFSLINQNYWAKHESKIPNGQEKYILVDLLVCHPCYLIGNAVMAKYLQYHHGYKVLALVPPKEHGYIRELARSYGFTEFVGVDEGQLIPQSVLAQFPIAKAAAAGATAHDIRQMVMGISIDGIDIGDIIYDSYLSGESPGTIQC